MLILFYVIVYRSTFYDFFFKAQCKKCEKQFLWAIIVEKEHCCNVEVPSSSDLKIPIYDLVYLFVGKIVWP